MTSEQDDPFAEMDVKAAPADVVISDPFDDTVSAVSAVTNEDFLKAIFRDQWERAHVTHFKQDPAELEAQGLRHFWGGSSARTMLQWLTRDQNNYFTVSLFRLDPTGKARRRKSLHDATYCIVLDDVGEHGSAKVDPKKLCALDKIAWKLETSPGNFQVGYRLSTPCQDRERVELLLSALVNSGISGADGKDPGMMGVTRYGRLPVGANTKKKYQDASGNVWQCRLTEWHPERSISLDELAQAYGISKDFLDAGVGMSARLSHAVVNFDPHEDATFVALEKLDLVLDQIDDERWNIVCPWADEHTDKVVSGTAYFPLTGGFKCHHGHCETRTGDTLREFLDQKFPGELEAARGAAAKNTFETSNLPDLVLQADRMAERVERARDKKAANAEAIVRMRTDAAVFTARDALRDVAVPTKWLVNRLIPEGVVSSLYGEGGVGKSLWALQAALELATGQADIMGFAGPGTPATVVYAACEDDRATLTLRLHDIAGVGLSGVDDKAFLAGSGWSGSLVPLTGAGNLHLLSRVGEDNLLMRFDTRTHEGTKTPFWKALKAYSEKVRADLVIVDTAADTFGGNESDRGEVRRFIQEALFGLRGHDRGSVLLLAHPSVAGAEKRGASGSTAWTASVRSHVYLDRDPDAPDILVLTTKKSNYGPRGHEARYRWVAGRLTLVGLALSGAAQAAASGAAAGPATAYPPAGRALDRRAEACVYAAIRAAPKRGYATGLSCRPQARDRFLPRWAVEHGYSEAGAISASMIHSAMNRLLNAGAIEMKPLGADASRNAVSGLAITPAGIEREGMDGSGSASEQGEGPFEGVAPGQADTADTVSEGKSPLDEVPAGAPNAARADFGNSPVDPET